MKNKQFQPKTKVSNKNTSSKLSKLDIEELEQVSGSCPCRETELADIIAILGLD